MAAVPALEEQSPLIKALPPNTDYITYLTILEYQLTSQNLHILNNILKTDDGSLAKEIGWDLLRLVLPRLTEVPADANECLELIAERGNPREVVVRIAEELEKLGRDDEDEDEDEDEDGDDDDDELRTFSGEATRIHLGEMKLDGMPRSEQPTHPVTEQASQRPDPLVEADSDSDDDNTITFQALLSMLSIVHPRIKTQYPSRFLATSLPAALTTYRRMPKSTGSTEALLTCLEKLAAKQRPPLPARKSASDQPVRQPAAVATLPDPEAPTEAAEGTNIASQDEKDIIHRLLQAVVLEVLDEYVASLQDDDIPSMLWTTRLRESTEAHRLVPGKPTAQSVFKSKPYLVRDALMKRFVSVHGTLALDLDAEINKLTAIPHSRQPIEVPGQDQPEEPSEYPTSPDQIPFPTTALIIMLAALQFEESASTTTLDLQRMASIFDLIAPLSDRPIIPNAGIQDALHSLTLNALSASANTISSLSHPTYTRLFSALTQAFTITPDAQARDDAHFIATKLLHLQPSHSLRLELIKQTIRCSTTNTGTSTSTSPPNKSTPIPLATPFTEGALKAIGVNWLKDEFLRFARSTATSSRGVPRADNTENDARGKSDAADATDAADNPDGFGYGSGDGDGDGLNPTLVLFEDRELNNLIFHPTDTFVSTSIASSPTSTHDHHHHHHLFQQSLTTMLPYPIALLNLCTVLVSPQILLHHPRFSSGGDTDQQQQQQQQQQERTRFVEESKGLLETLRPWKDDLLRRKVRQSGITETEEKEEEENVAMMDVYALEDAWGRLEDALQKVVKK